MYDFNVCSGLRELGDPPRMGWEVRFDLEGGHKFSWINHSGSFYANLHESPNGPPQFTALDALIEFVKSRDLEIHIKGCYGTKTERKLTNDIKNRR